jgi:hypothetical protein
MIKRAALFVALVVASVPSAVWAQAPVYVPVQGFLTDTDGVPVDGDTTMTFSLYVGDLDDTPVYTEEQVVLVEDGFFTVFLGQVEALDLALFKDTAPMYLGVAVGDEVEMAPRLALGSVPYAGFAQHAGDAATLGGMSADDFRASGDGIAWGDLTDVPSGLEDGDADALGGLSCAEGQVAKYDAAAGAWICGDDIDTFLDESAVDAMVDNNGYAAAGDLASVAFSGSYADLSDVPADEDTLAGLSCADGQLPKWDDAGGAWVCADDTDTDSDTLAGLFCTDGQLAKWDDAGGVWVCADDTDTDSDTLAGLSCADGQLPKWDAAGAVWSCADDVDTGFTSEAELTGLLDDNYAGIGHDHDADYVNVGEPDSITSGMIQDGAVSAADVNAGQVQLRIGSGCPANEYLYSVNPDGSVNCRPDIDTDTNTTYSAAAPITLSAGNAFGLGADAVTAAHIDADAVGASELAADAVASANIIDGTITNVDVDTNSIQRRVTGSCAAGSAIRAIDANGAVSCETDDNTAAPGTSFEISGGTAWTSWSGNTRITSFGVAARLYPNAVGAAAFTHHLPIQDTFAGRNVVLDSVDINYSCTSGEYIGRTIAGNQMDVHSFGHLATDSTDYSGSGSYTVNVSNGFTGSVFLYLDVYADDVNGECAVIWHANYHY